MVGNSPLDGSRAITESTTEVGTGETKRSTGTDRGQNNESSKLGNPGNQERSGSIGSKGANDRDDSTIQPGKGTKPDTDNRAGDGSDKKQAPSLNKAVNKTS